MTCSVAIIVLVKYLRKYVVLSRFRIYASVDALGLRRSDGLEASAPSLCSGTTGHGKKCSLVLEILDKTISGVTLKIETDAPKHPNNN